MKFERLALTTPRGRPATLDVPTEPRHGPSLFIIAGHKTGSVLLNKIVLDIGTAANLPVAEIEVQMWRQGISTSDWPHEVYSILNRPGYIFSSFRSLQKLPDIPSFERSPRIFMVRDPRDVAVSFYFSMAKSHSLPKSGSTRQSLENVREKAQRQDVNAFILGGGADNILRNIERFCSYKSHKNVEVYRYEDIIFEKRAWVRQILRDLSVEIDPIKANQIADSHDIRPEKENSDAHVRQVTPGNFKQHLSMEAISYLENRYASIFETFGYFSKI